jgi:hypothetical protein
VISLAAAAAVFARGDPALDAPLPPQALRARAVAIVPAPSTATMDLRAAVLGAGDRQLVVVMASGASAGTRVGPKRREGASIGGHRRGSGVRPGARGR